MFFNIAFLIGVIGISIFLEFTAIHILFSNLTTYFFVVSVKLFTKQNLPVFTETVFIEFIKLLNIFLNAVVFKILNIYI